MNWYNSRAPGKAYKMEDDSIYDIMQDGSYRRRGKKEAKERRQERKRQNTRKGRARRRARADQES